MSDLLSPLYAVFQDDALAFWAFVSFMSRMSRNFVRSQLGMRSQLNTLDQLVQLLDPQLYLHLQKADSTNFFFFFRMLLVWYKREFEWSDTLSLWERLWTDYLTSQFHLFIAVAIIEKHRDVVMTHLQHFDEVLKYINELSGTIELHSTLVRAEGLFRRFEKTVEAIDRRNNFPVPQGQDLRQRKGKESETGDHGVGESSAATSGQDVSAKRRLTSAGRPASAGRPDAPGSEGERKETIITPELRLLLSRKIVTLEGEDVDPNPAQRVRASGLKD